jgi:hypothetical protein
MSRATLYTWEGDMKWNLEESKKFYDKLKEGTERGVPFPFDCPYQVYLIKNRSKNVSQAIVAVFVKRNTVGDVSIDESKKLEKWYQNCGAEKPQWEMGKPNAPTIQLALRGYSVDYLEKFGNIESSDFIKNNEIQNQQLLVLYAFLAQAKTYGLPGFNRTITMTHSLEEYKDFIRQSVGCPQSEVFIIEPKEWNPPEITTVSQTELAQKLPIITSHVQEKMKELNLPDASSAELIKTGSVMPNPASGKVFFVYKVPKAGVKQFEKAISEKPNSEPIVDPVVHQVIDSLDTDAIQPLKQPKGDLIETVLAQREKKKGWKFWKKLD